MRKLQIFFACSLLFAVAVGAFCLGEQSAEKQRASGVVLRRSSVDSRTIEVHHPNGDLDEWQPDDGETYRVLDRVLENNMVKPPRPEAGELSA